MLRISLCLATIGLVACQSGPRYDVVIRHGTIYDGSGGAAAPSATSPSRGDRIAAVGRPRRARGKREIDATGLAVAPGLRQHAELGRPSR